MNFASKILLLAERARLDDQELAEVLGLSRKELNLVVVQGATPAATTAFRAARFFNCSLIWLLDNFAEEFPPPPFEGVRSAVRPATSQGGVGSLHAPNLAASPAVPLNALFCLDGRPANARQLIALAVLLSSDEIEQLVKSGKALLAKGGSR